MKPSYEEHFENFLINAPLSQKVLIYIGSLLFIAMIFLKMVIPTFEEKEESLKADIENIKTQIQMEDPKTLSKKVRVLKRKLLSKRSENEKIKADTLLLKSKLTDLPFRFNDKKSAMILDKILKKSLDLDIELNVVKSASKKETKEEKYIKLQKKIEISGKGKFVNIVYFLHYIEEIEILSDIKNIELTKEQEGKVRFKFDWLIYGVDL